MDMNGCFFCAPDRERVLYETEHFYVLLGLGPIIEGYTILVAKQHVRSMFDLPVNIRHAYIREKRVLKNLMREVYGSVIVTEHGRVQACFVEDEEAHDLLCYHAHQLFFPTNVDLSNLSKEGPFDQIFKGKSLFEIDTALLQEEEEYLLFEDNYDQGFVFKVYGKCPRQYMRYLVARSIDRPELASWAKFPGLEKIDAARDRYRVAMIKKGMLTEKDKTQEENNHTLEEAISR